MAVKIMSKYTTELRFICENAIGLVESEGFYRIQDIIVHAVPFVFDFDFPIFDENYRVPLEIKILRHFYTREISEETVGLWKLKLCDKLNVIMPYFNQLYTSELIKFNPLWDTDVHTSHVGGEEGIASNEHEYVQNTKTNKSGNELINDETKNRDNEHSSGVTNNESNASQNDMNKQSQNSVSNSVEIGKTNEESRNENANTDVSQNYDLYSDTPQGALEGVENETYLTNARKLTNDNVGTSKGSNESEINNENSSITQNNSNVDTENTRTATTNATSANSENRNREQDSTRIGNRINAESSNTDYRNTGSGGNRFNNTNQYLDSIAGKRGYGSYSKMLMEFRDTFLNIDDMVLKSLEPLFFGLW